MNDMPKKDKIAGDAEQFVRSVLEESFGQKEQKDRALLAEQVSLASAPKQGRRWTVLKNCGPPPLPVARKIR